jgi:hypothetical protein
MTDKRSKLDKATDILAKIIKQQIDTLPQRLRQRNANNCTTWLRTLSHRGERNQLCPV